MFKYLLKREVTLVCKNTMRKYFARKDAKEVKKSSSFYEKIYGSFNNSGTESFSKIKEDLEKTLREEKKENEKASQFESIDELIVENKGGLDIDEINTDIEIFRTVEKEKEFQRGGVIEYFKSNFNVNVDAFSKIIKENYSKLNYKDEVAPSIEKLKNNGFNHFHIKIILQKSHPFFLNSENTDKLIQSKNNLNKILNSNFSDFELCDTIACLPNIVNIQNSKIESNINIIKTYLKLENSNDLKSLLLEYPILITNFTTDLTKLEFYFKLYLDMTKEEMYNFVKSFPLILIATPDNVLNIFKTVDRLKFDRKEFRQIIEKNPKVFLFRHTQITNVVSLITKQGIKAKEVFEIIKEYPDLLLANRFNMLKHKFLLFEDLKINKDTIKNLIKAYPFILLKSYNSFIYKVFYFSKELKKDIEDVDIYPLVYVYNLNRDIKPRCELMKRNNKWIPLNEALSLTLEDLATKLNVTLDDLKVEESGPLYERDLLFRYSKYLTI